MLQAQWADECTALQGETPSPRDTFNLLLPHSRCPHCGHQIRWYENIPVLSYLFLQGKCSSCGAPIGLRYPIVELLTAFLFAWCIYRFGATWTGAAWCLFCTVLLALAIIDWDTTLLPDDLTLPLLWAGLMIAALQWNPLTTLTSSVWGAAIGYLSLWSVYWLFKLISGKEGMGYGDFKLLAALGAWFGWQALISIVLLSSVCGIVVGITLKAKHALRAGGYIPFGPFLAAAGFGVLFFGPQLLL